MRLRPEVLKLLDSSIPFLSPSGQKIVQSTQNLAELIQSPVGLRTMEALGSLATPGSELTANDKSAHSGYNPFSLFLVFYLLILASDFSNPSRETTSANEGDSPKQEVLPLTGKGDSLDGSAANPT